MAQTLTNEASVQDFAEHLSEITAAYVAQGGEFVDADDHKYFTQAAETLYQVQADLTSLRKFQAHSPQVLVDLHVKVSNEYTTSNAADVHSARTSMLGWVLDILEQDYDLSA